MVKIKQNINKNLITVSSSKTGGAVIAGTDASIYYSNLSKEWACKMPASVDGIEYSAKYYMQKTKQEAIDSKSELQDLCTQNVNDMNDIKNDAISDLQSAGDEILDSASDIYDRTVDKAAEIASVMLNAADIDFSNITTIAKNKIAEYGNSHYIGEVVSSTIPLADAGLHLLDGSLISGSGSYGAFVDYISGLVADYPDLFDTEANWQSSVTNYGVCGKFVYDSVSNTVRLPKYGNQILTVCSHSNPVSVFGTGKALGLTDGTGDYGLKTNSGTFASILSQASSSLGQAVGTSNTTSGHTNADKVFGVSTNSANSGLTGLADISKYALDCYYYIVIATSTKTQIQVDIDEIATDLNGKADVDLSNVPTSKGILTESYHNGASWYRVYSDGFCEQGGSFDGAGAANTFVKVSLLKPYANTNYTVVATNTGTITTAYSVKVGSGAKNETDGFYIALGNASATAWWQASGYIS